MGVSNEVSLPQFKVLGHRQRAMEISLTTGNGWLLFTVALQSKNTNSAKDTKLHFVHILAFYLNFLFLFFCNTIRLFLLDC